MKNNTMNKNNLFIEKSKELHGEKYDYSLVNYINSKTKVKIICKEHGVFEQRPDTHLNNRGCIICSKNNKKLNHIDVLNKFKEIHGDEYDYSLVNYSRYDKKVKIICKEHGVFEQIVSNHIKGKGCSKCKGGIKLSNNDTIIEFIKIHGDRYDYSLVDYKNSKTKVKIICKEHGVFEQNVSKHIKGSVCIKCSDNKNDLELIKKFNKLYNNKYDYSINEKLKNTIKIICHKHGTFTKRIYDHLNGKGCPKCSNFNKSFSNIEFINKSNEIHDDKYDYSLIEYENMKTKVKIICENHGIFEQLPKDHINNKTGCPICKESKGENEIRKILHLKKIKYISQKKFNNCKYKSQLFFDFYLPEYNICIEYDGVQHFKPIDFWGGKVGLEETKKRDDIKNKYCKNNNIKLVRIKYNEIIEEKLNNIFNI